MAPRKQAKNDLKNTVFKIEAQPGKQTIAMDSMPDVMIYGGAAGCVSAETEYLSEFGWRKIKDYSGEDIYQYNPDNKRIEKIIPYFDEIETKDNLYRIENASGIFQELSMEHRFVFYKKKKSKKHFEIAVGDLIALQQAGHPLRGYVETYYGKRIPFNISGKENTYLKIFETVPTDGYKYCFETPSSYLILRRGGHTFVTGNSGKSRLLLLKALKFAHKDPLFDGVLFRRTTKAHRSAGGLFTEAKKLYAPLRPIVRETVMEIEFQATTGGKLKFDHLELESTAEANHQGTQYSMVGFDELTHFSITQFLYLIGRLRSESETESFCLSTCNPDADSWVLQWVIPYLDDKGFPTDEMCGKQLYFLINNNEPVFSDSAEELEEKYPDLCEQYNPNTDEMVKIKPKTFMFIGGTIFDNPALIRLNPGYLASLKAQTKVNRERLLDGCWYAREQASSYFQREWLNKITYDKIPKNMKYVRAWDKAASIPTEKYKYPDYTVSIKMAKDSNGNIYIFGDYILDSIDEKSKVYGRFRRLPGERDTMILKQSLYDNEEHNINITVVLPKDPSAAGAVEYQESAKKLISNGMAVKSDAMPGNKKKLQKFTPFSSACQNGFVYIVEDSFPNQETLDHFYRELEVFNGERSTATVKDDIPDACASAFNTIQQEQIFTAVAIPSAISSRTKASSYGLTNKSPLSKIPRFNKR